jgi:hypothetical protein
MHVDREKKSRALDPWDWTRVGRSWEGYAGAQWIQFNFFPWRPPGARAQAPTAGTRGRTSAGFKQTRKARPTPQTQGAKTSWPVGAGGWPAGWWLAASGCGSPSLPTPPAAGSPARDSIPCATCRFGLVRGQRAAAIAFARERACVRAVVSSSLHRPPRSYFAFGFLGYPCICYTGRLFGFRASPTLVLPHMRSLAMSDANIWGIISYALSNHQDVDVPVI